MRIDSTSPLIAVCFLLLLFSTVVLGSEHEMVIGNFSAQDAESGLPEGWEPLIFKNINRHTRYELVRDGNSVVLKAESIASASGLVREIRIDPENYKYLSWRWKVTKILDKADPKNKEGDDYPARIYVNFEYDPQKLSLLERIKYKTAQLIYGENLPLCAITYVWGSRTPKKSMIPSSYSDKVVMIFVESGESRLNQWVEVTRNIHEDYRKAFNSPPPPVSGFAIMTDTDDTGESAVSYYGDIVLRKSRWMR